MARANWILPLAPVAGVELQIDDPGTYTIGVSHETAQGASVEVTVA
ncbi:MAG: hypothetical protein Q8R28_09100 [Dehalococcoidia bacterium]|nr:hypothetical protein [Dehalococcoidia bacterium]